MKAYEVIQAQIKVLEDKLETLRLEYDHCTHPPREVHIQLAIANTYTELRSLKRLLKTMGTI